MPRVPDKERNVAQASQPKPMIGIEPFLFTTAGSVEEISVHPSFHDSLAIRTYFVIFSNIRKNSFIEPFTFQLLQI